MSGMKRAIKASTIFDGAVDVYLIEDGTILLSSRGAVRALTGGVRETSTLASYLSRLPSDCASLPAYQTTRFILPRGGTADGLSPDVLLAIMRAYSQAFDDGLLHKSQEAIAKSCNRLLRALTEVGLVKVCEEALGIIRPNAEGLLRSALFRDDGPAKDSIWPDRFVSQYARWNGIEWEPGKSPPFSMKGANGFFYDMVLTPEERQLVKAKGLEWLCNQHKVFADRPRDYIRRQLDIATALALNSISEPHWRKKMRVYYQRSEPSPPRSGGDHGSHSLTLFPESP